MDANEMHRARGVVTALLNGDENLARNLIVEDESPEALAWGASVLMAGLVEHHCRLVGTDPRTAWVSGIRAYERRNHAGDSDINPGGD